MATKRQSDREQRDLCCDAGTGETFETLLETVQRTPIQLASPLNVCASLVASVNRWHVWRRHVSAWGFIMRPPTLDRWLYLTLHRSGYMGRPEREFFEQAIQPGMHVADVGANIGLYSLLFSRLVGKPGRVYAFEPDELMVDALRENLAANSADADVFACAAGASVGDAVLRRGAVNSGDNRLSMKQTALKSGQMIVPVNPLADVLAGRRVDFVKMDVQGWEGEALKGSRGLLEENPHLKIYFEFWPHGLQETGTSIDQFAEILRELGLLVWKPQDSAISAPVNVEELAAAMHRAEYMNLVASRDAPARR